MPAALLGAVRCRRCGHAQPGGPSCDGCAAPWTPASSGRLGDQQAPLAGVARATLGRRCVAYVIDAAAPLALLVAAIALARTPAPNLTWLLSMAAAVAVVAIQSVTLLLRGRTIGRLLLRLRTVDDLTGTPVRPGRLLRRLGRPTWHRQLLAADLTRGRDPMSVQLLVVPPPANSRGSLDPVGVSTPGVHPARTPSRPATAVGIVLDSGERYRVSGSLLIGRNPVDTGGPGGRALLAWPDMTRRLAKTHALLEWSGNLLWVTDLGSSFGTSVTQPGGQRQPLAPGVRTSVTVGTTIECGGRSIKVVPGG